MRARPAQHRPAARATALAAAVVLALTACGGSPSDEQEAPGAAPSADGAFPVSIEHVFGSTEVEAAPERVVALGLSDQDALLALGVAPVAVSEWYGEYEHATWPWSQDELGDAEPVVLNGGVRDEANPPVEEIAALEPDLILSLQNGTTEEQYEQLSEIAPVVLPTEEFADFAITWQEQTRVTGLALGREDEALALVEDLEGEFAQTAQEHPEFAGLEVVVAERFEPGESVVRTTRDNRGRFFEQMGFTVPEEVAGVQPDEFGEIAVSDELLDGLSRDLLVWNVGSDPGVRAEVEGLGLYPSLPVVQQGRVLWLEDPVVSGAFSWSTVLSLDYALEQVVPQVERVVPAS